MGQLATLYNLAALGQHDPTLNQDRKNWACVSLALFDYRRGNYPKAIEWCKQCLASPPGRLLRNAAVEAILAMSYHQLNQEIEARAALVQGQTDNEGEIYSLQTTMIINGDSMRLYDGIYGHILLRQAAALIEGRPAAADPGYFAAEASLGMMFYRGWGVDKNRVEGERWFRKAADQASVQSLNQWARFMAISSDPERRNGAEAVNFAEKATSISYHS